MHGYEHWTRSWKRGLAALGALSGLALAPAPAQAEVCGDFGDIADDLLAIYLDEFGELFPLSEKTCEEMTKTFDSACNTAVKDAKKCWDRVVGGIPKAAKPPCNERFQNPSTCYNAYKNQAKDEESQVNDQANAANGDCNLAKDDFFDACRDLLP